MTIEKLGSPVSVGFNVSGILPVLFSVTTVCVTGSLTRYWPKSNVVPLNVTLVVAGGTALTEPNLALGPQPVNSTIERSAQRLPGKIP